MFSMQALITGLSSARKDADTLYAESSTEVSKAILFLHMNVSSHGFLEFVSFTSVPPLDFAVCPP